MAVQQGRKIFVPEVIQTSAMDCGPACLKSLLEGFGVHAGYGRLREACQTDVDGTSIDALEETAVRLGLKAEQRMIPADHFLLSESQSLPAILVVLRRDRVTHFVLVWRKRGGWVQIMDPATGRQWVRGKDLLARAYRHVQAVPIVAWREWAASDAFLGTLRSRMMNLGIGGDQCRQLAALAAADPDWKGIAGLDAAVRMTTAMVSARAIRSGAEAVRMVKSLLEDTGRVPQSYWSVVAHASVLDMVEMRGIVLLHASAYDSAAVHDLSPELTATLSDPQPRPLRILWGIVRQEGLLVPACLAAFSATVAAGAVAQGLLFRGVLDISLHLNTGGQRLTALASLTVFLLLLLALEWPLTSGLFRLGRRLENRCRIRFLEKLPRMGDRYFQSRLISDMAQRAHSMHIIRTLPALAEQALRAALSLIFILGGFAWLFPQAFPLAAVAAVVSIAIPVAAEPLLRERDLRWREHEGALSLFFFDALRGLAAIRAHGAAASLRRVHAERLGEWAHAGLRLQRAVAVFEGLQMLVSICFVVPLVLSQSSRTQNASGMLLLVYWALGIPALGQQFAGAIWQYPRIRNVTLRLLEPMGVPEEPNPGPERSCSVCGPGGVEIQIDGATVIAGGQMIVKSVQLFVRPGEHVAIVGASGAGKSTLLGLLLGWHRAAASAVRVDGVALDSQHLEMLRHETAWISPEVQLWNASLFDNLLYGSSARTEALGSSITDAALEDVLEKLPDGLDTRLGEGGSFLSAGEGQRVRTGRALARAGVRLVLLDEPVRGLEHDRRLELTQRLRERWRLATLLCITHDVRDAQDFGRVVVLDQGRIVEDGEPRELLRNPNSWYRRMCDSEAAVQSDIWSAAVWRRLTMSHGKLMESRRAGCPS
jgi:ABC-type bacteriocin/lantibiotic exporter with double-glycine peptidase domain